MTAREFVQKALDDLGMTATVEDDVIWTHPSPGRDVALPQIRVTVGAHSEMFDQGLLYLRMGNAGGGEFADVQMRDEIKYLFAPRCYACTFPATSECDHCGKGFCSEHGDPGGDRDGEGGPVAYPSTCEACRASYEREMGGGK